MVDHAPFRQAVKRAYEDPLLDRSRTRMVWQKRKDDAPPPERPTPPWLRTLVQVLAVAAEFGLWIVLGLVVLALALTARRWLPWVRGFGATRTPDSEVTVSAAPEPDALPDDLAGQARGLWREGRPRRALALLYRGSVEAMAARIGRALVPGSTEAQCLRASRGMPEPADREAFARIVRTWQLAAYAHRLPHDEEFESLLGELSLRFGWAR